MFWLLASQNLSQRWKKIEMLFTNKIKDIKSKPYPSKTPI
jgi:hypothetical protein